MPFRKQIKIDESLPRILKGLKLNDLPSLSNKKENNKKISMTTHFFNELHVTSFNEFRFKFNKKN